MAGHEAPVSADHGGWFHDQHHGCESVPVEGMRDHGQDGPVGGRESGPVDLSLQNQDLMAKGEDLGVTFVTGHQEQPETSDQ